MITALSLALPPEWCQVIAGEPVECCPGCADDGCGDRDQPAESDCQCGKATFKQPDQVSAPALIPSGFVLPVDAPTCSTLTLTTDIPPPRNLQQLLCCWRN